MTLNYNVKGDARKSLVHAIRNIVEAPAKYLGAPSFSYEVDYFTIDKNGGVSFDDRADSEEIKNLIEELAKLGFVADLAETADEPDTAPTGLCVSMPRSMFTDSALANLEALVVAKGGLIKKALEADELPIEVTEDKVSFPWFNCDWSPEEVKAYDTFICKLCEMARTLKRANATEKAVDNEKYAFRCFLLRLGFIGNEYKTARKILLKNFSGSSAFKQVKKTYKVELDDDNFRVFTAENDSKADEIGFQIAEEWGSEFCEVSEVSK